MRCKWFPSQPCCPSLIRNSRWPISCYSISRYIDYGWADLILVYEGVRVWERIFVPFALRMRSVLRMRIKRKRLKTFFDDGSHVRRRGLSINLSSTYHQPIINLSSTYHQPIINLPSTYHHPTINLPSTQHQPTINLTSTYHQPDISPTWYYNDLMLE